VSNQLDHINKRRRSVLSEEALDNNVNAR